MNRRMAAGQIGGMAVAWGAAILAEWLAVTPRWSSALTAQLEFYAVTSAAGLSSVFAAIAAITLWQGRRSRAGRAEGATIVVAAVVLFFGGVRLVNRVRMAGFEACGDRL